MRKYGSSVISDSHPGPIIRSSDYKIQSVFWTKTPENIGRQRRDHPPQQAYRQVSCALGIASFANACPTPRLQTLMLVLMATRTHLKITQFLDAAEYLHGVVDNRDVVVIVVPAQLRATFVQLGHVTPIVTDLVVVERVLKSDLLSSRSVQFVQKCLASCKYGLKQSMFRKMSSIKSIHYVKSSSDCSQCLLISSHIAIIWVKHAVKPGTKHAVTVH